MTPRELMARAIQLAERGLYTTMPNPRVGCVIADSEGNIVAEGWHQRAGLPHAEIEALSVAGDGARGATVYVTLEPCSHTGRTGPCADALIQSGVARVVYGMQDPNPAVSGRGLQKLKDAGIEVEGPLLEEQCRALNPGFIKRMTLGLPFVRCKSAMSLDGRTAMASGESKWVTGPAARADVQRLRARSCAIVTGVETVRFDNPNLNVRADEMALELLAAEQAAEVQPLRVIVDSKLRTPPKAFILQGDAPTLVATTAGADISRRDRLEQAGAEVLVLPADGKGRVDLSALLKELARRQCNEILVESGATLSGEFLYRGHVDELIVYMAPKLLGSTARPLFELPIARMGSVLPVTITDMRAVGHDWRITATTDIER
ncbi:bifunctional diaminohydroxyphosphoribosylaminopyrimidine deaminase/5-amino-6-(5-phosphoribosylamino)uracil reductase RibD [Microbulbifer thermotolerans]|uniref:Riboflavin biosynthesis protein RibD n=2 Tax=Microbulbifer thermotolerans TaxID=252514 RepID=A0AB35HVA2_MICTH|nr:bifunctional diaminohydroxyphosphoribosylaminopyrimidine deaminase/5-amino-6-(5-phosphoribosylamino)uracil reductase RibD [Microbulbifer thermotolerans]MCX2780826.1 bifunctional diaminohydroxyphosphoribosylaminopyrimidine deaminase/5-amino-6-(5-phosphoribosylamino)uracil reductase RibD [Microbulbifer thermotolerans]MCX2784133.1 bifunctional diaminohydroxyphosphoribosylaminopyrimidine deaminase/5-amino-6-(5-phosphoribosylamino)uracil reductase RibD [Microbulbifer thermotolerans]MCX2801045.1 bi